MSFGPVFHYERTRTSRRPASYLCRAILAAALPCAAWTLAGGLSEWAGVPSGVERPQDLVPYAELAFAALIWIQGLFLLLAVPAIAGGSIAEHDRRGTMTDWLASPLSGREIVLGILAARLLPIGTVLGVCLPLVLPLTWLGVLDGMLVGISYGLLATVGLSVATLSLLVSVVVRQPRSAVVVSYLLVGGWLLLPFWCRAFLGPAGGPLSVSGLRALNDAALASHPGPSACYLCLIPLARRAHEAAIASSAWQALRAGLPWAVGSQLAASALFLLTASLLLRPLRLRVTRTGGAKPARPILPRRPSAPTRPAVGDDPMLWKELHASGSPAPRWARLTVAVLIVLLLGTLIGPSVRAFREWQADSMAFQARQDLNRSLRQLSAGLAVLGLAAVAAAGATSITGERERGTWTWLEMTPITGPEIARAKVAGTLWGLRGLAAPFLVLWTIGLAIGSVHPLGGLAAAAGLVVFAWAATALGVLASSIATTSERALTATFLVLLLGNVLALSFVPLDLVGSLAGSRPGLFLAGVSPFMEWIALASPAEVQAARGGWAWDEPLTLPFGLWRTRVLLTPALIPTFAASLALHAAVALGATQAVAGLLDRRHRTASRKTAPV